MFIWKSSAVKIVSVLCSKVVVSLTSHEQKKEAISPTHDSFFPLREVDKVGLISMNIATHIIQGRWNRCGKPGNRRTNVCCVVPEKLADAISEVLNSENFLFHASTLLYSLCIHI